MQGGSFSGCQLVGGTVLGAGPAGKVVVEGGGWWEGKGVTPAPASSCLLRGGAPAPAGQLGHEPASWEQDGQLCRILLEDPAALVCKMCQATAWEQLKRVSDNDKHILSE